MFAAAWLLVLLSVVAILWPRVLAVPIAVLGGWVAISLFVKAYRLRNRRNE
jgi:cardiolipin synthase